MYSSLRALRCFIPSKMIFLHKMRKCVTQITLNKEVPECWVEQNKECHTVQEDSEGEAKDDVCEEVESRCTRGTKPWASPSQSLPIGVQ